MHRLALAGTGSTGYHDRSNSYIHFLLLKLTGKDLDPQFVDKATMVIFLVCFVLTIWSILKTGEKKKQKTY
jgi:hypothetical protein